MFGRRYWILCILLLVVFPVSAQNGFITLNWKELPAAQTLPVVTKEVPLPDDFRFHTYRVKIEFPEFETLGLEATSELLKQSPALPNYPRPESSVQVSAHRGFLMVRFVPVVYRNGIYQRINSFKLSVTPMPATRAMAQAEAQTTKSSVLSSGRFVKIRVPNTGIYRITSAELKKMGFSSPEKVRLYGYGGYLLSQQFALHPADDLPEVPFYRQGDALLFYARGGLSWVYNAVRETFDREQNFYSDYGYYFLTEREEAPLKFPVEASAKVTNAQQIETFNAYALYEQDSYSWGGTGRELYEGYDYSTTNTRNYSFTLPGITGDEGNVKALFAARSLDLATTVSVSIGGNKIGSASMAGVDSKSKNAPYEKGVEGVVNAPWTGAKSEKTVVTVTHTRPASVPGRLNYIALNYHRRLRLDDSFMAFRSSASINKESTFVISGATASTVVWDVTSPTDYKQIQGTLQGDKYTFSIPRGSLREFVALNTGASFGSVESMGDVPNQNLHGLDAVDMVIIAPDKSGILAQAERLAQAHREHDGLSVQIVTAPQVYNEFSSGTPDATAYRRLMKMFYDRTSLSKTDRPKYLLLFGDCSYDNRMITPQWANQRPTDYLLCYQSQESLNETHSYVTDDYFGFLDNEEGVNLVYDKLDLGIGRFPVRTATEAKIAVDKTLAYMENKQAGPWKHTLCYVSDNGDKNMHVRQAEAVAREAEINYPSFLVNRIYADAYRMETTATGTSYPQATKRLLQLFDQGMLIVNYTGHGSTTAWSASKLLTSSDIVKLKSSRLPLWITATCDFTRYDDSATSAGELAFLNEKGGAIALMTTSRVVFADQNSTLNIAFGRYLFSRPEGKRLRLGDIMRLAKCDTTLYGDYNKLNFSLIGDPALTLAYPDYQVKIDELDGPLTDELPYAKAGARVTVKGHVLTPDGLPANDFKGILHSTVRDSEESVNTLNNIGEGAFPYTTRDKELYAGSDSVRQGQFEFTFRVPLDINYSNKSGMLNLYAKNDKNEEVGGYFDRFLVGGTDENMQPSDNSGPKMTLYLNTPDFAWGGQTNETPQFVAELQDEDGINTVGNGIGHDLSLTIDGRTTYSLNDYYTQIAGDYTRGTVRFSLPALSDGKHTLRFRAWDIMNHSSTQTLDFEVVTGLRPGLFSVECTQSPARENTTFILSHNRPGSELDVRIAVCDLAGRELWVHTEQGISSDNYYYVDWDLCSNAGQRLAPGIYLFRASIVSGDSKESTKSQKIVILAQ